MGAIVGIVPHINGGACIVSQTSIPTYPTKSVHFDAIRELCSPLLARLGTDIIGTPRLWQTRPGYAVRIHNKRLVVIGNAANTILPVTAHGLNSGIADAIALRRALDNMAGDIPLACAYYAQQRHHAHHKTRTLTQWYARSTVWQSPLVNHLRSAALLACHAPPIQRTLLNTFFS